MEWRMRRRRSRPRRRDGGSAAATGWNGSGRDGTRDIQRRRIGRDVDESVESGNMFRTSNGGCRGRFSGLLLDLLLLLLLF